MGGVKIAEGVKSLLLPGRGDPLRTGQIQDRLTGLSKESQSELQGIDFAELKRLDETYIEDYARKGPVFAVRADLYSRSLNTTRQKAEFSDLIGTDWAALKKLIEDVSSARKEVLEHRQVVASEVAAIGAPADGRQNLRGAGLLLRVTDRTAAEDPPPARCIPHAFTTRPHGRWRKPVR